MGPDALEYPVICLGPAQLHGWLHHMGNYNIARTFIRKTRPLIHSQLAPITGILLADYWVVQKQAYDVDAMYDPSGRYRYNQYGTNWRAVVAWFVAWIPLTPGFASGVGSCPARKTCCGY
jgi:cytosine/uracil/thiamine/allantoin permease